MLRIYDTDVLDRLGLVEGERWRRSERQMRPDAGVEALRAAWFTWQADTELRGTRFEPALVDIEPVIYGAGGYHRYLVTGDGEVVLHGSSATADGVARARAAGIRVSGGPHRV